VNVIALQEKLILSREQEILREHGRWERAIANHGTPLSVCTILRDEEIYNFTEDQVRLVCSTLSILFCEFFLYLYVYTLHIIRHGARSRKLFILSVYAVFLNFFYL